MEPNTTGILIFLLINSDIERIDLKSAHNLVFQKLDLYFQ